MYERKMEAPALPPKGREAPIVAIAPLLVKSRLQRLVHGTLRGASEWAIQA
jgi:hypothetical protein